MLDVTALDRFDTPTDYDIELLKTWTNFSKERVLVKVDTVSFKYGLGNWIKSSKYKTSPFGRYKLDKNKIISKLDTIVKSIDTNDYRIDHSFNKYTVEVGGNRVEKHIPLLKSSGIPKVVDPLNIYLAIEEYFSAEKTSSERTESVGITDKEKIENHGFDVSSSFRGK